MSIIGKCFDLLPISNYWTRGAAALLFCFNLFFWQTGLAFEAQFSSAGLWDHALSFAGRNAKKEQIHTPNKKDKFWIFPRLPKPKLCYSQRCADSEAERKMKSRSFRTTLDVAGIIDICIWCICLNENNFCTWNQQTFSATAIFHAKKSSIHYTRQYDFFVRSWPMWALGDALQVHIRLDQILSREPRVRWATRNLEGR